MDVYEERTATVSREEDVGSFNFRDVGEVLSDRTSSQQRITCG